jgi:hypothetical protein
LTGETHDHRSGAAGGGVASAPEEPGRPGPSAAEPGGGTGSGRRLRAHLPRPGTVLAVLAVALFAAWGIGGPLIGHGSTAATSTMVQSGPWPQAGFNDSAGGDNLLFDTYTAATPGTIVSKSALAHGEFAGWDPYGDGGGPLGSVPNDALLSPLTIPYYVLPTWMGPAYTELLIIVCGVGGSFLFLRRLGLSRVAGLLGGLAFAGSGFLVMWVNFPQTRTAAFVPALFWTVERFLQTRRVRDAALIAVPVAAMLLGGFPSVTGYAVITAACYAVSRLIALHRGAWRRMALSALGCLAGLAAGVGLVAFQLLPFQSFMKTWLIIGRSQAGNVHIDPTTLVTLVAPWAFGTGNVYSNGWYLSSNAVETIGYIGAAALVLALVAVALPWRARPLLPRSVWTFFTASAGVWLLLNYVGGAPLGLLQKTPVLRAVFGQNFIGRSRSVLGFLLAVLVAIGYDLLLRRRETAAADRRSPATAAATAGSATSAACAPPSAARRLRWIWPVSVVLGTAAVITTVLIGALHNVAGPGTRALGQSAAQSLFDHQISYAVGFAAAAVACALVLWFAGRDRRARPRTDRLWRGARFTAAAVLPFLLAWQSGSFASEFFPRSPVNTFYPVTDTHSYLADNLGEQRYASTGTGMLFGTNSAYALRAVNGHNFINQAFAAMIDAIPHGWINFETYIDFPQIQTTAASPILDQLGAKYWVTALSDPVFGDVVRPSGVDGTVTLQPGRSVTVPVPVTGRVRAVGVTPVGTMPTGTDASLDVVVRNAAGSTVAHTDRLANTKAATMSADGLFEVPVAADNQPAGQSLIATVTWYGSDPLTVQAVNGAPALGAVAGRDDGFELVHVGDSAVYQRLGAQPRIRWASRSQVVTDQAQRLKLLTSGKVGADDVVLSAAGPAASGAPGRVSVDTDGAEKVSATVEASGAGYLVVADADQVGWKATVDGVAAPLRAADQGVVAVAVPAGRHVVTLTYSPPGLTLGLALTGLSAAGLVGAVVGDWWWTGRRRRRRRTEAAAG